MARACTVCTHSQREGIETALVGREPNRRIAARFAIPETSLRRHAKEHLPQVLAHATQPARAARNRRETAHLAAAVAAEEQRGINVLVELERCFARVNKLFDACDAWLTDPDDASKYDIGPRGNEIQVTYFEAIAPEVMVRRKASLEELLNRVHDSGLRVDRSETKYADPRKLVLDTAGQLVTQLRLLVELMERAQNAERMARFETAVVAAIGDADAAAARRLIAALRSLGDTFAHPLAG
jgi:hypothetical protein